MRSYLYIGDQSPMGMYACNTCGATVQANMFEIHEAWHEYLMDKFQGVVL